MLLCRAPDPSFDDRQHAATHSLTDFTLGVELGVFVLREDGTGLSRRCAATIQRLRTS